MFGCRLLVHGWLLAIGVCCAMWFLSMIMSFWWYTILRCCCFTRLDLNRFFLSYEKRNCKIFPVSKYEKSFKNILSITLYQSLCRKLIFCFQVWRRVILKFLINFISVRTKMQWRSMLQRWDVHPLFAALFWDTHVMMKLNITK